MSNTEPAVAVIDRAEAAVSGVAPMTPPERRVERWMLSAHDAEAHGLAPLGFSLAGSPRSMIVTRFPAPGTLAVFAGPPGGHLGIVVEIDTLSGSNPVTLRDALRTTRSACVGTPRIVGDVTQVILGGQPATAVPMLAGVGPSRAHYCVVIAAAAEGASRGLLLWFYTAGYRIPAPDCAVVMAHSTFREVAEGFRLEGI